MPRANASSVGINFLFLLWNTCFFRTNRYANAPFSNLFARNLLPLEFFTSNKSLKFVVSLGETTPFADLPIEDLWIGIVRNLRILGRMVRSWYALVTPGTSMLIEPVEDVAV